MPKGELVDKVIVRINGKALSSKFNQIGNKVLISFQSLKLEKGDVIKFISQFSF